MSNVEANTSTPNSNGAPGAWVRAGTNVGQHVEATVLIRKLNHWFGSGDLRKQCLFDNDLTLNPGELVVMTGPSGSGKTTILTLVGCLRTVQEGSVRVLGQELRGLGKLALTDMRRNIGFIFQAHNLFDSLTALENVRMSMELKGVPAREMVQRGTAILTRLGLGQRIHYKPQSLSGGQRQRVAIARALVNRPKLILADEPTAALDKASGREVVEMLKELAATEGSTVLLVTHDSRILDVADRIVNMIDGHIASEILVEETVTICEFLIKCSVFASTPPATLTEISQKMVKEHYTPGATIIKQGDEGDKFFVVVDGTVHVVHKEGEATTSELDLGPGNFFGERALLTGEPRNATITAQTDVILYSLKKGDFLEALNKSGNLNTQLRAAFFTRK
jgi:putative ABC transport system ATP-binding protein